MFSSTNDTNVASGYFGAYDSGSISSSVLQFGSSSPPSLLVEDDRMLVEGFLSLLDQNDRHGRVGLLVDHHRHHHSVDGMNIAAGNSHGNTNQLISSVVDKVGEDFEPTVNKRPARRLLTGKRDRHSKICTAKGPRDRRMRLSVQVARKFFDLQDTLGFDKASHTIEWLFNVSKNAIKDVMGSIDNRSACDRTFGGVNVSRNNDGTVTMVPSSSQVQPRDSSAPIKENTTIPRTDITEDDKKKPKTTMKKYKNNSSNKKLNNRFNSQLSNSLRKDVRNKARARARERTSNRLMSVEFDQRADSSHQGLVKASEAASDPNTHCGSSGQAGSCCSPFDHVDKILINSAKSRHSMEELMIHADWGHRIDENLRFYSNFILEISTPDDHQSANIRYQ